MAPPLINLPGVAGSISLAFSTGSAASAPEKPAVQRPASTEEPAPAQGDEPDPPPLPEPSPPALPDPLEANTPAEEPTTEAPLMPPEPQTGSPPQPTSAPIRNEPEAPPELEPEVAPRPGRAERLLRPRKARYFFNVMGGGSGAIRGGSSYYYGGGNDLAVEEAIGGFTRRFPHFGIAFVAQQTLGITKAYYFAPRFEWDNQLTKNHAFYLTTNLQAGYRVAAPPGGLLGGYAYHGGFVQVGWGAKLVVADRLLLTFRPVNFRLAGPGLGSVVDLSWDVTAGVGVLFGAEASDD